MLRPIRAPLWVQTFFLLLSILCAGSTAFAQKPPDTQTLVIAGVTIIDVTGGPPKTDQWVVIQDDRITAVGSRKDVKFPRFATLANAKGRFLIPGLWDMHVHLVFGDWFPAAREISLPLFLANGVTGVRDMGSELDVVQNWRNEIEAGRLLGPRILTSGPMLDGPKPRFPSSIAISSPEDGRRAVSDLKRSGADFIKLQSLIPREAVFAIADEAKKQEIPFAGHVPDAVRAGEMSNAGMASFEHLIGIFEGSSPREDEFLKGGKGAKQFLDTFDDARFQALAALLAKNQTWQCPTLVWEAGGNLLDQRDLVHDARAKYVPNSWKEKTWKRFTEEIKRDFVSEDVETRRKFVAKELVVVGQLRRAGVSFLAGTDAPPGVYIFPGFSLHEELQLFVAAGFTPLEALQTATINPARFFGMADRLGTVEAGKLADLVLLDANPLDDIRNTLKIAAVISNGRFFSRGDLDKMLARVEAAARRHP
jgi:imidazolonepropionase-like amidohydrolase